MPSKRKKKNISSRKMQRGAIGSIFVIGMLAVLVLFSMAAVGGNLPSATSPEQGKIVTVITPTPGDSHNNLQLKTFGYITLAPTPTLASSPTLCQSGGVNDEPEILVGYSPASSQAVGSTGQIKVWVTDEGAPIISANEQLDPNTGKVITPGDRTQKAPDGYLWEPALYIAPQTAESGGTPHFPTAIKGDYNNNPNSPRQSGSHVGGMDTPPSTGSLLRFTAEDIWDISSLGLSPGTYQAEFVIHDGDDNRGVGCVSIQIQ